MNAHPNLPQLVYLALTMSGRVVAHFDDIDDASTHCRERGHTLLPYNRLNRDGDPEPRVGSEYRP